MIAAQQIVIWVYLIVASYIVFKGYQEAIKNNNPYGLTPWWGWMGVFVWGDGIVIGSFWMIVAMGSLMLHNFGLFWLMVSIFWVVRAMGEMIYWMHQQYSKQVRNPPESLIGSKWIKNDSIWFVYQIFWQCVMVFAIVSAIFSARRI